MVEIRRILFPVDFTLNSSKILLYVLSLSEKYEAVIYLLHVVEDFAEWGGILHSAYPHKAFPRRGPERCAKDPGQDV